MTRDNLLQWLFSRWAFATLCCVLAAITAAAQSQNSGQVPASGAATASAQARSNRDAPELTEFKKRIEEFAKLHRTLETTLPKLPSEASPEQIDRHQRALATLVSSSRPKARPGDIFTPAARTYIHGVMERLFANANRRQLRESIQDENPGPVKLAVNGKYPEGVPLSTMPPEVLEALPLLPDELEYRFVGDALILLDSRADVVVDFLPNTLPK